MDRAVKSSLLGVLAVLLLAGGGQAQATSGEWDASRLHMTRDQLQEILARYEAAASSDGYSDELRARARYEATLIHTRLDEGDFRVGDRIVLSVLTEPLLTDTFAISPGTILRLPAIGDISLAGVLRAELEDYLTGEIGRYLKEPELQARSLMRISVLGAVGRPGFYMVPPEALLTDLLMIAGGPGTEANLKEIRVERGDEEIWEGEPLQQAITEGRTLDQLSLQAGDRIVVPQDGGVSWGTIAQVAGLVASGVVALFQIF